MNIVWKQVTDFASAIFGNYLLMSAVLAWLSAQIIKIFTGLYQHRKIKISKLLFSTGGMPSSHSASVVALTIAAGLKEGWGSPAFAIAGVLSVIVMIDASGVRYETGKQSAFLNKIAKEIFTGDPDAMNIGFKELVGHTPLQVFIGALLGVGVAVALYFLIGMHIQ